MLSLLQAAFAEVVVPERERRARAQFALGIAVGKFAQPRVRGCRSLIAQGPGQQGQLLLRWLWGAPLGRVFRLVGAHRSGHLAVMPALGQCRARQQNVQRSQQRRNTTEQNGRLHWGQTNAAGPERDTGIRPKRSEEHTSELQSRPHLVCRLLLEKKKKNKKVQEREQELWSIRCGNTRMQDMRSRFVR